MAVLMYLIYVLCSGICKSSAALSVLLRHCHIKIYLMSK